MSGSNYLQPLQFGEYTLSHETIGRSDSPMNQIAAHHGGNKIGHLRWDNESGEIKDVDVNEHYQRQGIGRAMYNMGQGYDPAPQHSDIRSDEGDSWAKSVGGYLPERMPS